MARSQFANGSDGLKMWRVVVNILTEKLVMNRRQVVVPHLEGGRMAKNSLF